jgi:ketosteroid isomerase-like protein
MNEQENRRTVERFWNAIGAFEFAAAGDLLSDDYVGEYPQSGERIRGRDNFVALNKNYPGAWRATIRRVIASGDQVASEVLLEHNGQVVPVVSFFDLRDGRIVKEVDYWPDPFPAQEWRAQWVERI